MKRATYLFFENYMMSCMEDSAHDKEHVYRVLCQAMEIAKHEKNVDYDVLICACLLHDIGRKEQFENPSLCHAQVGAEKAYKFLVENGYSIDFADKVSHCILCHRFRNNNVPQSIEAKILFDADKIDVTGAMGIARTLMYKGQVSEPIYSVGEDGNVLDGSNDVEASFLQEYKYKLEKIYDKFYTEHGTMVARKRQEAATKYYNSLLAEITDTYEQGKSELKKNIDDTEG